MRFGYIGLIVLLGLNRDASMERGGGSKALRLHRRRRHRGWRRRVADSVVDDAGGAPWTGRVRPESPFFLFSSVP
ncbi:hypothetical protein U1Q18_007145, partial [Sarracenia purpurea var. burkii]